MPVKVDKVVITNFAALKTKYGPRGLKAIRAAVTRLVAADKRRGLKTVLVDLDSKSGMKSVARVMDHRSCRQNKEAIDGIYRALTPDYIMILGSRDVIPHQDIKNPLFTKRNGDDPDQFAWGIANRCRLLLCGHTHGGQIRFPVIGPVIAPSRFGSRYASGVFSKGETVMHVSSGISGIHPYRWGCMPEVTILVLARGE